jgi:hypothetical protein
LSESGPKPFPYIWLPSFIVDATAFAVTAITKMIVDLKSSISDDVTTPIMGKHRSKESIMLISPSSRTALISGVSFTEIAFGSFLGPVVSGC